MASDLPDDILEKMNGGDAAVADALFRAYTPYLRAIVRRQLSDRLRGKLDSADVVQSVWVQVVKQLAKDGWQVGSEDQLRGLLATIARRRLITRVRQLDRRTEPTQPDWDAVPDDNRSRPSEVAAADDLWDRMVEMCPPVHRPVLHLRRQGLSTAEIAERTELHDGSVRRILRQLSRDLALRQEPVPDDRPVS